TVSRKEPPVSSQLRHEAHPHLSACDDVHTQLGVTGGARAQTVTQPEESTSVIEGAPVQVKCNYSSSGSPYLFWYVQYPNQGPQLLLKHTSGESIKGFTANLNKGEKSFHLKKLSAQEEDSAMYYCALSDTVTG
uniref:Ig-like domain-containing protein n=1 Tax=Equus caballus TaxID=9796 RepID=A0A3Q2HDC3_HORSE